MDYIILFQHNITVKIDIKALCDIANHRILKINCVEVQQIMQKDEPNLLVIIINVLTQTLG